MLKKINFSVPITESLTDSTTGDFMIRGVAINATTTRNKTKFLAQDLDLSAHTLRDKPILKDHENLVDNIVGRTTQNVVFDHTKGAVMFEGLILDENMRQKITQGLIRNVSIGAHLTQEPELERNEAGEITAYIAKGIDFVELSLVAVPADPNAGFAKAIMESCDLSSQAPIVVQEQKPLLEAKTMEEQQATIESLRQEREQLEKELETLRVEQLKREKATLTAATIVKDETKGEVATAVTASPKYQVERLGRMVSISADYNAYDQCNRLHWKSHKVN